jgi:hypothetical protein
MSNPTTPFSWQMPTATDLVTDLPADFEVFGQAVATSMADLLGGTTGQILAKNSATDMDFIWTTANPGDITGVTAGTGISGGGTSGDVTVTNSMATAIDAKGDLIAGTAADTFSRLAVGTNGQTLVADSTASTGLKWATPSSTPTFVGALASTRAAQNVNNNTFTAVPLATQDYSTNSIHSTTVNNSRFTIPSGYGGKWLFYGTAGFDSMPAGSIQVRFYKNGSSTGQSIFTGYGGSGITSASISVVLTLAAADYIELMVFQNSGGTETLLVSGSEDFTFMGCSYLGA